MNKSENTDQSIQSVAEQIATLVNATTEEAEEQKRRMDAHEERVRLNNALISAIDERTREDAASLQTKMTWTIAACAGLNAVTVVALLVIAWAVM